MYKLVLEKIKKDKLIVLIRNVVHHHFLMTEEVIHVVHKGVLLYINILLSNYVGEGIIQFV